MPSLFRFLFIVGTLAALVYFGMLALATFFVPQPHQITEPVPFTKFTR